MGVELDARADVLKALGILGVHDDSADAHEEQLLHGSEVLHKP